MKRNIQLCFISIVGCIWFAPCWGAERLSSTMGEVLLRNLQPGQTYRLTSLLKFPLRVTYEGDKSVLLLVDPALPEPNEMKEGYEVVPSTNWVSVDPSSFELEKSSIAEANITLSIPDEENIRGKKFVVYVWSRAIGKGKGMGLGLGVKSRLLITIAKERAESTSNPVPSSYMNFSLEPSAIDLKGVKPGTKVNVNKSAKQKFHINNFGDETNEFSLEIVSGDSLGMSPPQGRAWGPQDTEFTVAPQKIKIARKKKSAFKIEMKIPDLPENYDKKLHYILRVTPAGVGMTSGILFRINVETIKKQKFIKTSEDKLK